MLYRNAQSLTWVSSGRPHRLRQSRVCRFATPASFLLTSNDPAGFNVIDVLAWGALGHALGYFILVRSTTRM